MNQNLKRVRRVGGSVGESVLLLLSAKEMARTAQRV